jgi:hypothetical protein
MTLGFTVADPHPIDACAFGEFIEDRTRRPLVAMTGHSQCLERALHRLQLVRPALNVGDVGQSDASDIGARSATRA